MPVFLDINLQINFYYLTILKYLTYKGRKLFFLVYINTEQGKITASKYSRVFCFTN